jgi:hypothetical protein
MKSPRLKLVKTTKCDQSQQKGDSRMLRIGYAST